MNYIPQKLISLINNRLIESDDLTKPLSTYLKGTHYLVVSHNLTLSCLSLSRILTSVKQLDLTKSVGDYFNNLTDLFVNTYRDDTIPIALVSGLYNNRLNVFNPLNYGHFDVYFTSMNTPEVKDDPSKRGFLDDLAIAGRHDMSNYLVAINGVFHRTSLLDNVLYVHDGYRTIRLSGRKDILVVDTKELGGHTIIPLTKDNVSKSDYQKIAIIKTPSSIQNKTVFAVIDGYFYHHDQHVLDIADQNHLRLKTNKLPLIEQFRHNPRTIYRVDRYGAEATQTSRKYLDLYDAIFLNNATIPTSMLANKDFQYSRLTNYHSFLVVINNPALYTIHQDLIPSGTFKTYLNPSQEHSSGMLSYGCGLSPSYLIWKDAYNRKTIFISDQDNDVDQHNLAINPSHLTPLIGEALPSAMLAASFTDYVCA